MSPRVPRRVIKKFQVLRTCFKVSCPMGRFHALRLLKSFTHQGCCFKVSCLAAVSRLKGEGTSGKIREHLTDDGAFGNVAFDNKVVLTDNVAFGNEIAQTDDFVIVEATRTSAFLLPKANRQVLVYFGDPIFLQTDEILVCSGDPTFTAQKKPIPP